VINLLFEIEEIVQRTSKATVIAPSASEALERYRTRFTPRNEQYVNVSNVDEDSSVNINPRKE
jgi:type IV secretory pathway component VirB8